MSGFKSKRKGGGDEGGSSAGGKRGGSGQKQSADGAGKMDEDELVFEDPFGDEFEEEQIDEEAIEKEADAFGDDSEEEDEMEEGAGEDDEEEDEGPKQVWRPGVDKLEDGETLDYDPSAYVMYHALSAEWPCLSFDIMRDRLGDGRQRFPHRYVIVRGLICYV